MAGWPPQQEATCHFYFYTKNLVLCARSEIFDYTCSTLKSFVVFLNAEHRALNVELAKGEQALVGLRRIE